MTIEEFCGRTQAYTNEIQEISGKEAKQVYRPCLQGMTEDRAAFQSLSQCMATSEGAVEFATVCLARDAPVAMTLGQGKQTLRPFTVGANWEIRWSVDEPIRITPYDDAGNRQGLVVDGKNSGKSFQPRAGTYYLDVYGYGAWAVDVWQLAKK